MPPRRTPKTAAPTARKGAKKSSTKCRRNAVSTRAQNAHVPISLAKVLGASPVDVVKEPTRTRKSSSGKTLSPFQRLAVILHGTALVTMTTKAQIGVSQSGQSITATADNRWFEAVGRYCGFTVVLNDIVECGAAFDEWLEVSVTVKPRGEAKQDPFAFSDEGDVVSTFTTPSTMMTSTATADCCFGAGSKTVDQSETVVLKLKLLRTSVPSVAEAEAFLQKRWGGNRDLWRAKVNFTEPPTNNERTEAVISSHVNDRVLESGISGGAHVPKIENTGNSMNNINGVTDEELLAQLSNELRASLSQEKLQAVIASMRREAIGLEAKEQEKINKRQVRERLLTIYDLVRVLLGGRRFVCSLKVLIHQMAAQNRFGDDEETILKQLASLARYRESGITMFVLSSELQQGKEGNGDSPLFRSKEVDVNGCSMQELDEVLLRLDCQMASRAKLFEVLQRE